MLKLTLLTEKGIEEKFISKNRVVKAVWPILVDLKQHNNKAHNLKEKILSNFRSSKENYLVLKVEGRKNMSFCRSVVTQEVHLK